MSVDAKTNTEAIFATSLFSFLTGIVLAATVFMLTTGNELWWVGIFSVGLGVTYTTSYAKDAIR